MQTNFYRNVTPHLKFYNTLGEGKTTGDTIALILKTVNTYANSPFIKRTVEILSAGNPDENEFCKRLFDVACKLVNYERDPEGHEIVFTPKLLVEVGQGDCKKFTTFILSVLQAKAIQAAAKAVSYKGIDWEHIYVIAPRPDGSYITLDPVNHCRFNSEVNYAKAQIFYTNGSKSEKMNGNKLSLMGSLGGLSQNKLYQDVSDAAAQVLGDASQSFGGSRDNLRSCYNRHTMAGLGNDYMDGVHDDHENESMDGMGKKVKLKVPKVINKIATKGKAAAHKASVKHQAHKAARKAARPAKKAKRREKRKKIFKGAKKVAFAPARGAFLGLILLAGALQKTPLKINLAAHMAKTWQTDNGESLTKVWESFGGKRESLRAALAKASKTQLSGEDEMISGDGTMFIEGIGSIGVVAEAATAIALSAPILIAVTKLMKDKNITSDQQASLVEDVTQAAEDSSTAESGGDAVKTLQTQSKKASNSALIKKGNEVDDGGNEATQRDIIKDAASEPMEEPPETAADNFTADESGAENFSKAAGKSSAPAARSKAQSGGGESDGGGKPAKGNEKPGSNLPAVVDEPASTTAKNILGNYKSPTTWLKGIIMLMPFQHCDAAPYAGGLLFAAFVATSIRSTYQYLFHSVKI